MQKYIELGGDTNRTIGQLKRISISIHCWKADDVGGFEKRGRGLAGGDIQVTGNYPGKARTAEELRIDLEKVLSLIPGKHRINLHAMYGEFDQEAIMTAWLNSRQVF